MKKFDVVALGELLIDFTDSGLSEQGNPVFEANPGGAPCNVLAMLSKLHKKTAFIGKVGDDIHGRSLQQVVSSAGIDLTGLIVTKEASTTLAFVQNSKSGEREFSFVRNPGADMLLTEEEISNELVADTKIFHFGTLSMTDEPARAATKKAVKLAKESGAIISFDPNLRPLLWSSMEEAKKCIEYGMSICDILKIADNEVEFLTGLSDFEKGAEMLRLQFPNIKLFSLTLGADGSTSYYRDIIVRQHGIDCDDVIEKTGAGDTFCGSILNFIVEKDIDNLTEEDIKEMALFANCAATIVTTRKGALKSMPNLSEIKALIAIS